MVIDDEKSFPFAAVEMEKISIDFPSWPRFPEDVPGRRGPQGTSIGT